jgi:hypothetical protein
MVGNLSILRDFKQNDADFTHILQEMKPGKRVMAIILDGRSVLRFSPAYMHFVHWYQAEKLGDVVPAFAHGPYAKNVPVRARQARPYPNPWNPTEFDWSRHKGGDYDYFVVRSSALPNNLFRGADADLKLHARKGKWLLYGKDARP